MSLMSASMIITGINILLIIGLLVVYVRNAIKMPSGFTIGLLLFASLFLVQNAVSFYFYATMMPYFVEGLESYVLIFNTLQMTAFAIMNWITWK